uniref:Probable porphobilinogen deaminase n=1 Tax=Candidatus Methanomethylicus mesodigestus TaxID=1867258 RepID=A0A7C3F021_9CREN
MIIRVGTRESKLAMLQTEYVIGRMKEVCDAHFSIVKIKTAGDIESPSSLQKIGSGIFEKEIDEALLRGEVDLAVHSMKDVPTSIPEGLILAAIPQRLSPNDVFVSRDYDNVASLPKGGFVGTSSPRRAAQIRSLRGDLQIASLRGNIDTRLRRLKEGKFHGIVLAEAALIRMGAMDGRRERLPIDLVPTSPGQGALAVIIRKGDAAMLALASKINYADAMEEVIAERAFLRRLGCGCSSPVGCTAATTGSKLMISCGLYSIDGARFKLFKFEFPRGDAERYGAEAAEMALSDCAVASFWRRAL